MLAALLTSVIVAAPDVDAEKALRIAWASQYEWKEHGVKNVTLDFEYSGTLVEPGQGGGEFPVKGTAQIVIVGNEIVRRHYPGVTELLRDRLDRELDWIVARFVRKPFDEEFKDAKFKAEEAAGGRLKVTADKRIFLLKDDRIAAKEIDVGTPKKTNMVRVSHLTGEVGGGYTITRESASFTSQHSVKTKWSRNLKLKEGADPPVPASYYYERSARTRKSEFKIIFNDVRTNLADPIVLDAKARDLLKEAWEKRYVLPPDIRMEGGFTRKPDKNLTKAGWISDVRGDFQVWGMDKITLALDERIRDRRWAGDVMETCTGHLTGFFDLLQPTPFDEEFKGCGFELGSDGKNETVRVFGHAKVLGFIVADGVIAGKLDNDGREGWWTYKLKTLRSRQVLVTSMVREIGGDKFTLKFKYGTSKGVTVPKQFDALGIPRSDRGRGGGGGASLGVVTYSFKKTKVTVPKN